jgi:hypothetical protein
MGCGSSKEVVVIDLNEESKKRNLPVPDPKFYENEFEKDIFITINLIRTEPKLLIPYIKNIKSHNNFKGQAVMPLINHLEVMIPLMPLAFDENACKACRNNNERKVGQN